jgi:hypothetical protein
LDTTNKSLLEGNLTKENSELEKLKTLVQKRTKLIRFADKSPAGWSAVEEYESDELAEDSDDEKKLRSAERRAMTKLKLSKQFKKLSAKGDLSRQPKATPQSQQISGFQPFRPPFAPLLVNLSQTISAPVVANVDIGQGPRFVRTNTKTKTALHPTVEPRHKAASEMLGQDKSS